jgi:uncharacterized protein
MAEMHLASIRVQMPDNTPVVLLQEVGGRRVLPILIGHPEANAIAFALQGVETPRPMTHDLMRDLLTTVGAVVERVVVTELVDKTYFAEIHLTLAGTAHVVSSRPSDAMALAVRLGVPIFADDELLDAEGQVLEEPEDEDVEEEDVIRQFQHFIDEVRPEDFAS